LCVAFANRHKYQLSEANSSADGELFLKEPPDPTADFGSDDKWDEEDLVRQPKEESTLKPTEQIPQEKSREDALYVKPANNILQAVKEEKLKRNAFRIELNKDKKMAAKVAKKEPEWEMLVEEEGI
jgi:hypothetical protein